MSEFKPIPDYEGRYVINREGVVKSVAREIKAPGGWTRSVKEKILAIDSYRQVLLYKQGQKRHQVKKLIARAFADDN